MRLANPGDELKAPGVLRNPVPVEALYDKQAPQRVTLRNLLQRHGYENLDAVLDEGKALGVAEGRAQGVAEGKAQGVAEGEAQGRRSSLLELCEAKGLELSDDQRIRISTCTDLDQLKAWVKRAITAETADALFD